MRHVSVGIGAAWPRARRRAKVALELEARQQPLEGREVKGEGEEKDVWE